MSAHPFAALQTELAAREAQSLTRRRRTLTSAQGARVRMDGRALLSFCSNDYLGLASHPALAAALRDGVAEAGVGSGASHLVTGHHALHQRLEQALADFVELPAALGFSSGYMANVGVVTALMRRGDAMFADKLNHASLNDAALLARATLRRYRHNDLAQLEAQLRASTAPRKLVLSDTVFSMDGDLAPLPQLLALCERYDAWLLLDDAHGFGVLGTHGQGSLSHFRLRSPRIIYMATLGKAAGVSGAFVAAEAVVIDYLVQYARSYVYTTATPPALAAAVLASLDLIRRDEPRRARLQALMAQLKSGLRLRRWALMPSDSAIQPLLVGDNQAALALSDYLLAHDILVPAIRPPTVPAGTARLRISLSAAHTPDEVERLIAVLRQAETALA